MLTSKLLFLTSKSKTLMNKSLFLTSKSKMLAAKSLFPTSKAKCSRADRFSSPAKPNAHGQVAFPHQQKRNAREQIAFPHCRAKVSPAIVRATLRIQTTVRAAYGMPHISCSRDGAGTRAAIRTPLIGSFPGEYPEVPEGGAVWVFALD